MRVASFRPARWQCRLHAWRRPPDLPVCSVDVRSEREVPISLDKGGLGHDQRRRHALADRPDVGTGRPGDRRTGDVVPGWFSAQLQRADRSVRSGGRKNHGKQNRLPRCLTTSLPNGWREPDPRDHSSAHLPTIVVPFRSGPAWSWRRSSSRKAWPTPSWPASRRSPGSTPPSPAWSVTP